VLVLLPPSETKRAGGDPGSVLDLETLSFPALTGHRRATLGALGLLSQDPVAAAKALKIGPALAFELERNLQVHTSPVMPAIDRYTGVLYDGLDAASLPPDARAYLTEHVAVASALFGLIRSGDAIPAYRLSHNSALPSLRLKGHWKDAIAAELAAHRGLILDLRSESYVGLGPTPVGPHVAYLRVMSESADGARRALNHFNKKGKGEFVRALAESGAAPDTLDDLVSWARSRGIHLDRAAAGGLELTV
jgi:cytoplasmic iron level regulating protein YaaA (DUF328/UPF0246 family)